MPEIRVRFAPSPTGDPHIGSIWTAHFNWLFARQQGGKFILRIEDTDQKRFVEGSVEKIFEALEWYGLRPDEGPQQGGPFGPYVQSQRLNIYQEHVLRLIEQGSAYYCFCTPERLETLRAAQQAAKLPPRYDKLCASIPIEVARGRVASEEPAVVRLRVPETGEIIHHDLIRGDVTFRWDQVDDSVLWKSDGYPTYHLANVVDDHLMEISHVIRAEEWLPSAPKHLLLYRAFGWAVPMFAHLPLLLGTDKSKLSKRHGATSALSFRDQGYLPEAMNNFLSLMGWHPKGDEEVLTPQQTITQFSLEHVNSAGAVFDQTKLDWFNGYYIRQLPIEDIAMRLEPFWTLEKKYQPAKTWQHDVVLLVRDRMKTLDEIDSLSRFFFPAEWDVLLSQFDRRLLVPKKGTIEATQHHLAKSADWLTSYDGSWEAASLKKAMLQAIAQAGKKNGDILWPLRVALSLNVASPDVFDILHLLGKEESLRRVQALSS